MRMQFQIWVAGMAMGLDMKTRAKRIKKRAAKSSTSTRKSKLQQVA